MDRSCLRRYLLIFAVAVCLLVPVGHPAFSGEAAEAAAPPADLEDLISKLAAPERPVRAAALAALVKAGPAAVDALAKSLASEDLSRRFYATSALGKIGDPRAIEPLAGLLADPNPFVRREAVLSLGRIKDRRAMPHLMKAMKDSDTDVRRIAGEAMTEIKNAYFTAAGKTDDGTPDIESLAAALNDASPVIRAEAAVALGKSEDERAADLLMAALNDPDGDVRLQAGTSLRALKSSRAAQLLAQLLLDGGDEQRLNAAKALNLEEELPAFEMLADRLRAGGEGPVAEKVTGDDGSKVLIELMRDEDPMVRRGAVVVMGLVRGSWPTDTFIKSLGDENTIVSLSAAVSLTDLSDGAVEPLLEALKDPDTEIRRGAVRTLAMMKKDVALEPIIGALRDEAPQVRRAALDALMRMRSTAVLPVCALLKDPAPENRRLAADLLTRLRDARATQPLIGTLRDAETAVVRQGIAALSALRAKEAVRALMPLLEDGRVSVRVAAADALNHITGEDLPGDASFWKIWWQEHRQEYDPSVEW